MVSKQPHTKKNTFLCMNTFGLKKKFQLLEILFFSQRCFSSAENAFLQAKPLFFKLKFVKISKSSK